MYFYEKDMESTSNLCVTRLHSRAHCAQGLLCACVCVRDRPERQAQEAIASMP